MHIADNLDRRTELDQCRLAEKHFARRGTDTGDFCILQGGALCDLAAVAGFEQALDHVVDIEDLEAAGGTLCAGDGLGECEAGGEGGRRVAGEVAARLACGGAGGGGEEERTRPPVVLAGETDMAEGGGGEEPRKEDLRPSLGAARMFWVVGMLEGEGEGGAGAGGASLVEEA